MRIIIKTLIVLLIVLGLLITTLILLPDSQYRSLAIKAVDMFTDRTLTVGNLKTSRSLHPIIELSNTSMSGPSWSSDTDLFSVDSVKLSIDLQSLLLGKLRIHDLTTKDLNVNLIKNESGLKNWSFKKPNDKKDKKKNKALDLSKVSKLAIEHLQLDNTKISIRNEKRKNTVAIDLPELLIQGRRNVKNLLLRANGTINELPFTIKGESEKPEILSSGQPMDFNLNAMVNNSKVTVEGDVKPPQDKALMLAGKINIFTQDIKEFSTIVGKELPSIGPIEINGLVNGDLNKVAENGLAINDFEFAIDDPNLNFKTTGEFKRLFIDNQSKLKIDLDLDGFDKILAFTKYKGSIPGKLIVDASLDGNKENYKLTIASADIDSPLLKSTIKGEINDLLKLNGGELSVELDAKNLDLVNHFIKKKIPSQWGPIKASAKLNAVNRNFQLNDIELSVDGKTKLTASGTIDQLIKFNGMNLDVDASLATLKDISAFTKSPLPNIGPLKAKGKLNYTNKALSINNLLASYNNSYGKINVKGDIVDAIKLKGFNLLVDSNLKNLKVAELFAKRPLPYIKGIKAKFNLTSPNEGDLAISNLKVSHNTNGVKVNVTGKIDSLVKNKGVLNLAARIDMDRVAKISGILKPVVDLEIPLVASAFAKASIIGSGKKIAVNGVTLTVDGDDLKGAIEGDIGVLSSLKGINLKTDIFTRSLNSLLKSFNIDSHVNKPARILSHIEFVDNSLKLHQAEIDVAGNKIIGDLAFNDYLNKNKRSSLVGQINIMNFDVSDFENPDEKPKQEKEKKPGKIFSKSPLPFKFIRNNDIDLDISIGKLRGNIFDIHNMKVDVIAKDGVFKFGPLEGDVGGGKANLMLDIDAQKNPALIKLETVISEFDIAQAGAFRDSDLIQSSGGAHLKLNINGRGESMADIMSTTNGGGVVYIEDILVKKGALRVVSSDVIRQTLDSINPFKKKPKDTEITCIAAAFDIKDGKLNTPNGLAAESKDFSIIGNAQANFKDEEINIEFKTKAKKGFGLGFGKLSSLVQVQGDMASPSINLNPKGVLEIGFTLGAAIATGGLWLLAEGQYDKIKAKSELCANVLASSPN